MNATNAIRTYKLAGGRLVAIEAIVLSYGRPVEGRVAPDSDSADIDGIGGVVALVTLTGCGLARTGQGSSGGITQEGGVPNAIGT
jgi:hypothetical protein